MSNIQPRHVAIIMDGNGRWAQKQGKIRSEGHKAGAEPVHEVLRAAEKCGIKYLTLYAFSTENWGRPKNEIDILFTLLAQYLESETAELKKKGVRLSAIGQLENLPPKVYNALKASMAATSQNQNLHLTLALSYGSQQEISQGVRLLAEEALQGQRTIESISPKSLAEKLWTKDLPDPDLLIRTGGDMRLSNFLLWQCAYTELYFTNTLWPDFKEEDFQAAINDYKNRKRRFGLIDEQLA